MDIEKFKNEAFREAIFELKEEYSDNLRMLEKLERLEENEARGLKKISK